ncbi:MAG: tRNA (adenosine(37)-N6)-dimethylallyltransferase MiaA [Salibacteraceae bacterium]
MGKKHLLVIAGPTASGKTALSLDLAKHFQSEIFSADSRQLYRSLNIGTAKPNSDELKAVKHHFINTLEPDQEYTSGQYSNELNLALENYFQSHSTAIMVGGSGLYIKGALEGLDDLPPSRKEIRDRFNALAEQVGLNGMLEKLKKQDPDYFNEVDKANKHRVQRALEAIETSGKKVSDLRKNIRKKRDFTVHGILLQPDRKLLYERINQRVDEMMAEGLLGEVKSLQHLKHFNALQTVGYSELFEYLEGNCSLDFAVDKIKQHTRNYAKRQETWFKKQTGFTKFENADREKIIRHLEHKMIV